MRYFLMILFCFVVPFEVEATQVNSTELTSLACAADLEKVYAGEKEGYPLALYDMTEPGQPIFEWNSLDKQSYELEVTKFEVSEGKIILNASHENTFLVGTIQYGQGDCLVGAFCGPGDFEIESSGEKQVFHLNCDLVTQE